MGGSRLGEVTGDSRPASLLREAPMGARPRQSLWEPWESESLQGAPPGLWRGGKGGRGANPPPLGSPLRPTYDLAT